MSDYQVHQIGYDRDGDSVWSVGPGLVIGGPRLTSEYWVRRAMTGLGGWTPWRLADFEREFGPITKEKS